MHKINFENCLANLKELNDIFLSNGSQFWLDFGTLLGYVRENNFIDHTDDVDVGVNFNTFNKNIIKEMDRKGWKLIEAYGYPYDSLELAWSKRGERLDIFFYYNKNEFQTYCTGF